MNFFFGLLISFAVGLFVGFVLTFLWLINSMIKELVE